MNILNISWKYYNSHALNEKLILMGVTMKSFSKKLLGHEIFNFMVPWTSD